MSSRSAFGIRLAAVAGAMAAAAAVFLIARYGVGLRLHTPGFTASQPPTDLSIGLVLIASAVGSALGIGALTLIERTARRPRRAWVITAVIAGLASLSAPFAGHGISFGNELALACMHLAVGAVLIPVLAATAATMSVLRHKVAA
jgi:hypothetical protein